MKWFQHDANASHDAKIKKLILRKGAEGYAVYFHCLELIAGDLTQTNINFELEHDSEIIADNLKIKGDSSVSAIDKVNSILKCIIDLELFEQSNDKVFCLKMANRLDNTVSRSPEINKIKKQRSYFADNTKKLGAEYNTIHNNTIKEITTDIESEEFKEFWHLYDKKIGKPKALKIFNKLSKEDINNILSYLPSYIQNTQDKQFRKHPTTFLNQRAWEDEIVMKVNNPLDSFLSAEGITNIEKAKMYISQKYPNHDISTLKDYILDIKHEANK